jgi:hypothetical protein
VTPHNDSSRFERRALECVYVLGSLWLDAEIEHLIEIAVVQPTVPAD